MVISSSDDVLTNHAHRGRPGFRRTICAGFILVILLCTSAIPGNAKAEIPHENFDMANSDLDTVINLLNTSIRASEETLRSFYNQSMEEADGYLAMIDSILVPAQQVLSRIENVAGSYENLSLLLPPFLDLREEMGSFSSMESDLLYARTQLISLTDLANLSDTDLAAAIETIRTVNSLVANMNRTIDDMLLSAGTITNLTVEGRTPFRPNALAPLIEKLRDLLVHVLEELEPIIHNDMPWGSERSFLLLWIEDTTLYLGEKVDGGGYLFYNGSFRANHLVHVLWDGGQIIGAVTNQYGAYRFTITLEINSSLLGQHTISAYAITPYTNLSSDEIIVTVLLMPTSLSLDLDNEEISVNETVIATVLLLDVYGRPVSGASCELDHDGDTQSAITDLDGKISMSWTGSELGFGSHSFGASYDGVLPYDSSSAGPVNVTVSIPTHIQLELFSEKFVPGYYIVGVGNLFANSSQALPTMKIAIFVDERLVLNVTTDLSGLFALSIESTDLAGGTHTLRAAFLDHGVVWRYCDADVTFVITKLGRAKYPFFPFFPGWQTGPPEEVVYVFFGPYAYYVWLLMLVVLVIIVKTLQARKARASAPKNIVEATPLAEPAAALAAASPVGQADFAADWTSSMESPSDPNARIVWLYNMLLEFLRKKRRVTITDDMTHWEVARLLRSLGYPKESVERVTMLFERAFYSGSALTDLDSVGMSVAMDRVRSGGVPDAV